MSLHYETYGSGPELVLLHGWGLHGGLWQTVIDPLARNFCVHAVDLPGHGHSPRPGPLTLDSVVDLLCRTFDCPLMVAGWSLGGLFALEWARRCPEQVERLILVASSPCFRQRDDWPHAMADEVLHKFADNLRQDYRATLQRFLALQTMGDVYARAQLRSMQEQIFAHGEPDLAALNDGLELLRDVDWRTHVSELKQPGLLIYGARDRLVPPGAAHWLAGQWPAASLHLYDDSAHAPHLSHPVEFCEAIKSLL